MLKLIQKGALAGAMILAAGAALAEYPEKPIEVVVGYSAGGGTDVMARTAAPFIEKYLGGGASLVVKNVPGASGQIGVTEVAGAKPDGYTIGTFNLPGMMARTIDREAGYDRDSFTYLANVVNDPNVIVTSKDSGLDTMEKLIAAAKADPGAITVGMSSLGGDDHFALIKLEGLTETEFTIVPFKGSAPARTALMGGHVAMGILNISEVASFQDELNLLGVATEERSDFAPDLPTFREQGIDLINGSMRGFVAPAGLPEDVVAKLDGAFEQMAGDPEFLKAMADTANPVEVVTGDDFKQLTSDLYDLANKVWQETPWN
ncbi:Bug family tripartite tricarboxylate transporter substrate binding protein [Pseudooceanicola nanhaiensis]|uniref:Bug family tripartite tricarboxylate transporter substrate binding protein n=1 Tax=Pseudooceanicola nanhaiensis TaxID=375761 RepID=UPI001CD4DFEF|nr:tripartite tricarboxylate transporter substrate binding protein [Pseudooceanicola nanhaiensis]MCA0919257.1 tripartite tricarboxylate transporter substrate binding protein [Pseudooceanicola nanhaiensis]